MALESSYGQGTLRPESRCDTTHRVLFPESLVSYVARYQGIFPVIRSRGRVARVRTYRLALFASVGVFVGVLLQISSKVHPPPGVCDLVYLLIDFVPVSSSSKGVFGGGCTV